VDDYGTTYLLPLKTKQRKLTGFAKKKTKTAECSRQSLLQNAVTGNHKSVDDVIHASYDEGKLNELNTHFNKKGSSRAG
jgi:hypothetical protein